MRQEANYEGMGRTHGRLRERFKDIPDLGVWNQDRRVPKCNIQTFPVRLNAFDRDHNDGNDDTFLDLESSSIALGTQEMPETEADDEPDTDDSQSGGTISNVDEESDSDIDSRPSEAAKAKRIARQLRQLGDFNKGPASANVTGIYPSTLDYTYTIGHPLLDTPNACKVSSAPRNHREAMASAQALEWQASMERELASMSKHDVYELVPAPKGRKIIGSIGRYFQDQGIHDDQIRIEGPGSFFFDFRNAGVP